jgi:hypothetical protein
MHVLPSNVQEDYKPGSIIGQTADMGPILSRMINHMMFSVIMQKDESP